MKMFSQQRADLDKVLSEFKSIKDRLSAIELKLDPKPLVGDIIKFKYWEDRNANYSVLRQGKVVAVLSGGEYTVQVELGGETRFYNMDDLCIVKEN